MNPEVLATRCFTWPGHAVSTRSNALYDHCATGTNIREVILWPANVLLREP
jgi:hypothetical protein